MSWYESRGDVRGVIVLLARWAEVAEPTPRARMAEARAYLNLGLTDRAWIAVKDLAEEALVDGTVPSGGHLDALLLAGRTFLERGWHARARRPLEIAARHTLGERADDARTLLARADAPVATLPDEPLGGPNDIPGLLFLAHRQLAAGGTLKARMLLERVRKLDAKNARAADLLWGLEGDFTAGTDTLADLVARGGGQMGFIPDITDEAEHTESVDRPGGDVVEIEPDHDSFPSLFRGGEPVETTEDYEPEHTASSEIAELPSLRALPILPEPEDAVGGDTQIARVIRHGLGAEIAKPDGPLHTGSVDPSAFDLHAFRREMGVESAPPPGASDFDGALEDEDISRVVLIKRERVDTTDEKTGPGIEPLEPDLTNEEPRFEGSEAPTVSSPKPPTPALPPAVVAEPEVIPAQRKRTEPGVARRRRRYVVVQWWLLAIGLLLLFGASVVFLLVSYQLIFG